MRITFCIPSTVVLAGALLLPVACGTPSQSQTHADVVEASGESTESVAARVGDREITMSELDQKVLATNVQVFQQLYDARRAALGELVADALLASEAEKRGMSVEELVEQEITSEVSPVTDEEIENFFQQNTARLRGQSLAVVGPQIREFMESRNEGIVRQSYIERAHQRLG